MLSEINSRSCAGRAALMIAGGGVLLMGLLFSSGCFIPPNSEAQPIKPKEAALPVTAGPPVKIDVMADKTASTQRTRTQQLQPADVDQLIDLLRLRGGDLAVGLIQDQSNRTLLRLRVKVPPSEPEAPSQEGNAFEVAERMEKYKADKNQAAILKREWQAEVDADVEQFRGELSALLEREPNFRRTDVWGAIWRADLFLSESDAGWPQPTHRYLILVSDAQDNVKQPATPLRSGAKLILVNGSASLGSIASLNPERFESVAAAFDYVIANERGRK